jgi:hypothetical protein
MNKPNQKPSSAPASASLVQKRARKLSTGKPAIGAPKQFVDAPMHAAKGNDDTMSQPQASQIEKKTS